MNNLKNKIIAGILPLIVAAALFSSCNKDVQQFPTPVLTTYPSNSNTLAKMIQATPDDSLYYRMIIKSGLLYVLNDSSRSYTLFITNNNGMKLFLTAALGVPAGSPDGVYSAAITNFLPATTAGAIVSYNTVGQTYPFASIPAVFPNYPLPSQIILDPTVPFFRNLILPSRQGTPTNYVNTIPVISTDLVASNGIIHHTATVVVPPSALLKTLIAAEPTLSYFRAAITRADSGQAVGTSQFDYLLNYGVTNMTVLAPNDAAFQTFIFTVVYGRTLAATGNPAIALATANGAVAAGPAFLGTNNVTTAQVRGIIAYHLLASAPAGSTSYTPNIRVFSVNISSTPMLIKTLVNSIFPTHPGVLAKATFTGTAVTTLNFSGVGTLPPGGTPFSVTATAVAQDKTAVNGVYHIIDKVLLPQ